MKIVINNCYGGFSLSHKAEIEYAKRKGITLYAYVSDYSNKKIHPWDGTGKEPFFLNYTTKEIETYEDLNKYYYYSRDVDRSDPDLVAVVEELGEEANGDCAKLKIVEIPDGVDWIIKEYDGMEWVAEVHRTWS